MRKVWIAVLAVLGVISLYLASARDMAWWAPVLFGGGAILLALEPRLLALQLQRRKQRLVITDKSVRRELPGGKHEEIAWSELQEVWVLTTDDGPYGDDVYFGLVGADAKGVAVPHGLAVEYDLLAYLQKLPGFDNAMAVRAMGSTDNQRFVVWRASSASIAKTH
jgi:hypothetical protein